MSFFDLISPLLGAPAISILLQSIVNQHLYNSYCLTFVSEKPVDFNFNFTFTYLIPNLTVDELTAQVLDVSEKGCSDYIVNMRQPELFMIAFDNVVKKGNSRRSDRKVIFLPQIEDAISNNKSLGLFSMREMNYIANVLLIIPNKNLDGDCEIFDLVTHTFVGSDEESNQPWYLDQWDSCTRKFKTSSKLFPHDIKDLQGKTLKAACFTYKPYVLLDVDTALAPLGRDGVEMRIADEFCRWVNCTIEIIREDEDQWGDIYDNGTGIGVIGSVVIDRADMGFDAIYSWYEEYLYLDFTISTIRAAVSCLAPRPRRLQSLEMPLMPFTWTMWYAVLLTFVIASLVLTMAKGFSFDRSFLTVFGVMIAQSQSNAERTWRVRSVTGWLFVGGLILVSAYGGGLASTFTVPKYEASIDTIQDMVDRRMEWGATHDAWIFSLILSDEPVVKQLVNQFHIYSEDELKRKSFTRSMAFVIEKLAGGSFAIGDYLTKEALLDMTLLIEDFYFGECVILMRKSSPYTEKINVLIGRLHQSGLLLAWETQVALNHLDFKVIQEVKLSRSRSDAGFTKPLSIGDVVGVFVLYAMGILLSIFLFLSEILHTKIFKKS